MLPEPLLCTMGTFWAAGPHSEHEEPNFRSRDIPSILLGPLLYVMGPLPRCRGPEVQGSSFRY